MEVWVSWVKRCDEMCSILPHTTSITFGRTSNTTTASNHEYAYSFVR